MNQGTAILGSRGFLRVCGPDARAWLQGLLTNDVETLGPQEARFAALLSPQGKILFDAFVIPDGDGLLLDCAADIAGALAKRLALYRLRARVEIADLSASLMALAIWGREPPAAAQGRIYPDPRDPALGWRIAAPPAELGAFEDDGEAAYEAHRIACGAPRGGLDFVWGDAFPHEANMDRLHGLDFRKGCYVGQEVVSRVEHRGLARKRVVRVRIAGAPPPPGAEVFAGETAIGAMGSSADGLGLALLRLDRAEEARAAGEALRAGEAALALIEAPAAERETT
jgi:folate-binding protein YgfZ